VAVEQESEAASAPAARETATEAPQKTWPRKPRRAPRSAPPAPGAAIAGHAAAVAQEASRRTESVLAAVSRGLCACVSVLCFRIARGQSPARTHDGARDAAAPPPLRGPIGGRPLQRRARPPRGGARRGLHPRGRARDQPARHGVLRAGRLARVPDVEGNTRRRRRRGAAAALYCMLLQGVSTGPTLCARCAPPPSPARRTPPPRFSPTTLRASPRWRRPRRGAGRP
jgi:hypothetical protein